MAIGATTKWEFRATNGSNTNGGGYTSGGTDYSQQNSAQWSDTDLACADHVTFNVTSASSTFTAQAVGNIIYISDTGAAGHFVIGWYEITGYVDANTVVLDRDPTDGTDETAGDFAIGGALAIFTDAFFEQVVAGNEIHVKNDGTMTLTGAVIPSSGWNAANPIKILGYNSSRGDAPTGTNRPLIACGANDFNFDSASHGIGRHLRGTTSHANGFRSSGEWEFFNVKWENTAGGYAFRVGGQAKLVDCEGISSSGDIVRLQSDCRMTFCYVHDTSGNAIVTTNAGCVITECIIDTITGNGIIGGNSGETILNNTIYNCGTGINHGASTGILAMNNLIDSNTTGASAGSSQGITTYDYNNWNGNTGDVSNVTKGANATANSPGFANAAGGDFSGVDAANALAIRIGVG